MLPLSPKKPRRTVLSDSKSLARSRRAVSARSRSASKAARTISSPLSGFSLRICAMLARVCADSGTFSVSCTGSVIATLLCVLPEVRGAPYNFEGPAHPYYFSAVGGLFHRLLLSRFCFAARRVHIGTGRIPVGGVRPVLQATFTVQPKSYGNLLESSFHCRVESGANPQNIGNKPASIERHKTIALSIKNVT